jgi:hypothetical protein
MVGGRWSTGQESDTHQNSDSDGFAWKTSEWSLAPDTLALLRHSRPFESDSSSFAAALEGGGCTDDSSPWCGGSGGDGGRRGDYFRGRQTCSASGCLANVRSSSSTTTDLCALHRRACSGVRVAHDTVRWCYRCKSTHSLGSRAAQHDDEAGDFSLHAHRLHPEERLCRLAGGKKAGFCEFSSSRSARAVRGGGRVAASPSRIASLLRRVGGGGEWKDVGEARSFEISADAEPASLAGSSAAAEDQTSTPWSLVKRVTNRGNDDDAAKEDDEELLASVACAMLPGSTRLMVAARTLQLGSKPTVRGIAASLPAAGVMGTSVVTVSTFDEDPDYANLARVGTKRIDENLIGLAQGWSLTCDTRTKEVLSAPSRLNPMPPWIKMSPFAVAGEPFTISGFKGSERVHIFGQKMLPVSIQVQPQGGAIRVTVPSAAPGEAVHKLRIQLTTHSA